MNENNIDIKQHDLISFSIDIMSIILTQFLTIHILNERIVASALPLRHFAMFENSFAT